MISGLFFLASSMREERAVTSEAAVVDNRPEARSKKQDKKSNKILPLVLSLLHLASCILYLSLTTTSPHTQNLTSPFSFLPQQQWQNYSCLSLTCPAYSYRKRPLPFATREAPFPELCRQAL